MKRDEYIQHLKDLHDEGGLGALQPLINETLRREGPVHEVEYHNCSRVYCITLVETNRQFCDRHTLLDRAQKRKVRENNENS